ncbi:hypothetical protein [Virgibacillus sp. YIM 98842]|uniref:hypothetical protein n=1 Tax=Virgibacillus sp. YIM 98842 TaxID=2663533 RepID=UPI0013DC1BCD|nr:hypothetical protein [Virgibacillus sp. YIM 98842]
MGQSNIIYFPDKVQEELINVLDELVDYSVRHYKKEIVEATENQLDKMNISERTENYIFTQLFWWTIYCYRLPPSQKTIYQEYLATHKKEWKKKSVTVQQVLASWLEISPGFYYVEEDRGRRGKAFIFRDIFEGNRKMVTIHSKRNRKPVPGEVVSVLLLPMEDGSFISQGRMIHIPKGASASIVNKISNYYEKHAISPSYAINRDLYPELLRISLEALEGE